MTDKDKRKPLYRIADRVGVNCADRDDDLIADLILAAMEEHLPSDSPFKDWLLYNGKLWCPRCGGRVCCDD